MVPQASQSQKALEAPRAEAPASDGAQVIAFRALFRRPPGNTDEQVSATTPPRQTRRPARLVSQLVLLGGDMASYLIAAVAIGLVFALDQEMQRLLLLVTAGAIAGFAAEGLYPGYRTHMHERLRRRVRTTLKIGALACIGAVFLLESVVPAVVVTAFLALAFVVQPVLRRILRSLLRRADCWGEPAMILASPNRAPAIGDYFASNWQFGIRPLAPGETGARLALLANDVVPLQDDLDELRKEFAEIVLLADTPAMRVSGLRPGDLRGEIGVRLAAPAPGGSGERLGRLVDLVVAVPLAICALPVVAVAAAAIYAVDPGPVFYCQPREGLKGRVVRVLKLRTMFRDAEERLEAVLARDPAARAEWNAHFKLRDDPRVLPRVGDFLRSTSFDELPQLWNVILGEMSIVGPRPFPTYHVEAMSPEFRARRCSIMPGLTGLWQISERSEADLEVQRQLDEFYIDNRSLWFDWTIILGTVSTVIKRSGT